MLPWVSNLGDDHYFGIVFSLPGEDDRMVMAVADCGRRRQDRRQRRIRRPRRHRTFAIQFRKAFIPEEHVLADPVDELHSEDPRRLHPAAGGMAFGLIKNCIDLMEQAGSPLSHVNCFLPDQPTDFRAQLAAMEERSTSSAKTPFDPSKEYFVRVIKARLAAGDASVAAAHNAMLHCGARGYVKRGAAQRRLREAYFVAIVTPATKQLRKMLADLGAA
jgi:alkylation response protein AidB-like acyl-CoA dehydrogenase